MWACRLPVHIGPFGNYEFAEDFHKSRCILRGPMCTGKRQTHIRNAPSSRTAVTGIGPYKMPASKPFLERKGRWLRYGRLIFYDFSSSAMPAFTRAMDSSFPSSAHSSVAPPGVEALPDTATRSGQSTMEFLTSSFAASATSAS